MSIVDKAKADLKSIISNTNDFAVSIAFTAPDESTATINGIHTKHHLSINEEGVPVNAKNASVAVAEDHLDAASYPVRNSDDEVDLAGHLVAVADSTGTTRNYKIEQWFPDETLGLIVCILADYAAD